MSIFFRCLNSIKSRWHHNVKLPYIRKTFEGCGSSVTIGPGAIIAGNKNISFGDDVYIGPRALLYSTVAKIRFGSHITIGPKLSIVTGDHRIDVVGEYITKVEDKLPQNDKDVVIEDDVWMGMNVSIYKGVTIGRGSVIAGDTVVVKDVPPYSIYISKDKIKRRFTDHQIEEHERLLSKKYGSCTSNQHNCAGI